MLSEEQLARGNAAVTAFKGYLLDLVAERRRKPGDPAKDVLTRLIGLGRDVKTFKNFLVPVPEAVDPARFNTVIVWCETFGQFITSAKYR